ncbi:MAG: nickel-type superoxide dismutase maturation protease [Thermoplasmata archaeon]
MRRYKVKDRSMEPALPEGCSVLVNRLAYRLGRPRKGDLVVLRHPTTGRVLVKRVSEVEGDEVFVTGDNQAYSVDSRVFGAVETRHLVGKVILSFR